MLDFEVILVTDFSDARRANEFRTALRGHDQVVPANGNRFKRYNQGADVAKSEWLLLTEDHCVADPECILTLKNHLERNDIDVATLDYGHINHSRLAYTEAVVFERTESTYWSKPDCWDKVRARGFLIKKNLYLQMGGMHRDYAYFAEPILAANLFDAGIRYASVPGARISHVNTTTFKHLFHDIDAYVYGECKYREYGDVYFCEKYFGMPEVWAARYENTPEELRQYRSAVCKLIQNSRKDYDVTRLAPLLHIWMVWTVLAVFTYRAQVFGAGARLWALRAKFLLSYFNRTQQCAIAQKIWEERCNYSRKRYILNHLNPMTDFVDAGKKRIVAREINGKNAVGIHQLETWNDVEFRWTSTASAVAIQIAVALYRVTVDTASLRGNDFDFPIGIQWNDTFIPQNDLHFYEGNIEFLVDKGDFRTDGLQKMRVVVQPLPTSGLEKRELGIPIRSIQFERIVD